MIEAEGLSLAAKDISGELITQYYSCQLALMILFPMLEATFTYFHQILLEKLRDFSICFFASAKPAFHHLRRHFGVSVPAVEVQVVGHLKRILVLQAGLIRYFLNFIDDGCCALRWAQSTSRREISLAYFRKVLILNLSHL